MDTVRSTLIVIALIAPGLALANPLVTNRVPGFQANNIDLLEVHTAGYNAEIDSRSYAIERREMAYDDATDAVRDARVEREEAETHLNRSKRAMYRAVRSGIGVDQAVQDAATAERQYLEAKDFVKLQKAREHAAEERLDREVAYQRLALAERELAEAELLHEQKAKGRFWHNPKRYERQLARVEEGVRRDERRYQMALVHVRESRQDYHSPTTFMSWNNVEMEPVGLVVSMGPVGTDEYSLRRVHFGLGEATLRTDALNDLAWNAHVLRNHPEVTVRIEGHTDLTGPKALNRELAWDRAEAVQDFLIEQGVGDEQLDVFGFGEKMPILATAEATPVNRRAELRVMSNPDGQVDGTIDLPMADTDLDE